MVEVSYYATDKLFVVEAVDRSHPDELFPPLLHDRRVSMAGGHATIREAGRREAAKIAVLCGANLISYDDEGEATERAVTG